MKSNNNAWTLIINEYIQMELVQIIFQYVPLDVSIIQQNLKNNVTIYFFVVVFMSCVLVVPKHVIIVKH